MKVTPPKQGPAAVLDLHDPHDRRRLALDAEVDLRTLQRALAGLPIKSLSRRRIRRALAARGLYLIPPEPGE